MTTTLSSWGLSRRTGTLHWDGVSLAQIALHYGTPLYVVSRKQLEKGYTDTLDAFDAESVRPEVFFSVKTNPVPDLLRVLVDCGCGLEVVSEHELRLAVDLGVPGSRLVVNGTYKSPGYMEEAIACSVELINVESLPELEQVSKIATHLGAKARVALRVNPELKSKRFSPTVSTARSSSPMGFIPGSDEWCKALRLLGNESDLELRGIHLHLGSGIDTVGPYVEAIRRLRGLWRELLAAGFHPDTVDLGGGFGIETCKTLSLLEAAKALRWNAAPKPPSQNSGVSLLQSIARVWVRDFVEKVCADGVAPPRLFLEPGRAISASSQALLVRVNRLVERGKGPATALCDAGAMSLSPSLWSEYHSVFLASHTDSHEARDYIVIGNMPSQLDIISPRMKLPSLKTGDILAVMDTGAYFTSFGNTFAGPRPPIVMIESDGDRLIRRRETYEELFARDVNWEGSTFSQTDLAGH